MSGRLASRLAWILWVAPVACPLAFVVVAGRVAAAAASVASTLLIAALFQPVRRRTQNLIDRRFYRRKYDTRQVLAGFGTHLRDETNLEALTGSLLAVVEDTRQPTLASLWLCSRPPSPRGPTSPRCA